MDKTIKEMRQMVKDLREMADLTEKYADVLENPDSTDREKKEAAENYMRKAMVF